MIDCGHQVYVVVTCHTCTGCQGDIDDVIHYINAYGKIMGKNMRKFVCGS